MIIVEVLDRGGRVRERVRLAQLPATVGRGYGCDVIVEDPFAEAVHARLAADETGAVVVEDLGSANGLFEGEFGPRRDHFTLRPGSAFRIGHTLLRVATPDMAVAPALRDSGPGSRARRAVHSRVAALLLTLAGAPLFGWWTYLGSTEEAGASGFVAGTLSIVALVALWAGGWALATRIRSGRARFLAHVSVAWIMIAVIVAVAAADEWYRFLTEDSAVAGLVGLVGGFLIVGVPLYGHLAVASRLGRRTRVVIGVAFTVGLMGLSWLLERNGLAHDHREIAVTMALKPLATRWIPAETPEAFLERAAELQTKVDEEAAEEAEKK